MHREHDARTLRDCTFRFFPQCFFYGSICPLISQKARRGPGASVRSYNYVSLVSHTPSVTATALHKPIICCTSTRRGMDRNSAAAGTQMSGSVMVLQLGWNTVVLQELLLAVSLLDPQGSLDLCVEK